MMAGNEAATLDFKVEAMFSGWQNHELKAAGVPDSVELPL